MTTKIKLSVGSLRKNDYVLFESVDDLQGFPCGHVAKPGDRRYFSVISGYPKERPYTQVTLKRGSIVIHLSDDMFSDDNIFTVRAQFPVIIQDWHLRLVFPDLKDLPWRLRAYRFIRSLLSGSSR